MDLAKHILAANFGYQNFYEINDTEISGVRVVTPRVTNADGSVTEEVREEIGVTVEFVCCTPTRFRVNVTEYHNY
jgi:hypothetical protein